MITQASGYFITGTDTEVGKTRISTALMHKIRQAGLRVAGMKPVASGCASTPEGLRNEDALALQREASINLSYELINPYAFAPAIAPHLAAQEAGVDISIQRILDALQLIAQQVDAVIVEGVGGWQVPLGPRNNLADLAIALQLPVIMVVDIRLGCINHALLTMQSIVTTGLPLAGWVANHAHGLYERSADNIASIEARIDGPLLGVVQHAASITPTMLADQLRLP